MSSIKPGPGRPMKFSNPEQLQKKIDEYFVSCWDYARDMFGNRIKDKDESKKGKPVYIMKQVRPYTVTGLAVALDTTRETLLDYESGEYFPEDMPEATRKGLSDAIKSAKQRCHAYAEEQLFIGKQATGPIFNLKNNYGWIDQHDVTSKGQSISPQIVSEVQPRVTTETQTSEDNRPDQRSDD